MRDRGNTEHLQKGGFRTLSSLCIAFNTIMDTALDLCPKLTHCDVLPHNFAFDGTHLHLLDIDEGVDEFTPAYARELAYSGGTNDEDWLIAMTYPNAVRNDKRRYTQLQLVASFLTLASLDHEDDPTAMELRQKAEVVGKWLQKEDVPDAFIDKERDLREIDSLVESMNALVKAHT